MKILKQKLSIQQQKYDDKRKNRKKLNNAQKLRAIELTATTKGTIPFYKIVIKQIPGVREELRVRGCTYDEKDSIKALVASLKKAVENKDVGIQIATLLVTL